MMKKKLLLVLFGFMLWPALYAQDNRNNTTNSNAWFMYFGNHRFSERLGWHAEIQWRRNDIVADPQQVLLRTGLDIYAKTSGRFTLGYAFIKTYPYGEFGVPNPFPEHRIWQQYTNTQSLGKVRLAHRYRLEQRMIGNAAEGTFKNGRYENRVRYMAKVTIPLTAGEYALFLAAYDEVMINFGKEVAYNIFDQNRIYGALGVSLSANLKLEAGYLYQLVKLRSLDAQLRNRIENNHTLQLGLFSTIPFFDPKTE